MGSIQRGFMIARNDCGTLEQPDGKGQYIGSARTYDGKVVTKTFRSRSHDKDDVLQRWLTWQEKAKRYNAPKPEEEKPDKERADMESKTKWCPISKQTCIERCMFNRSGDCTIFDTAAGGDIAGNIDVMRQIMTAMHESMKSMVDAVETMSLAMMEKPEPEPKEQDDAKLVGPHEAVMKWLETKDARDFFNTNSQDNHKEVLEFCKEHGYQRPESRIVTKAIKNKFENELDWKTTQKGTRFTYKKTS